MVDIERLKDSLRKRGLLRPARALKKRGRQLTKKWQRRRGERWAESVAEPPESLQMADPDLWREAEETAGTIGDKAANRLSGLEHLQLGGGGECRIIYYFTRLTRARHAVETGVAAGWSSAALLLALESNGGESRHLWSSELPYDRPDVVSDYRPFIGLLVADALKQRWSLYLQGDKANIPVILQDAGDIDIFHYDSRKTKRARSCTLDKVLPHMNEGGAIIIDDIGDNTQFATWVAKNGLDFRVFRCEGKYVGVVQLEHTPYSRRW